MEALKRTLLESRSIAVAKEGASGLFLAELLQRLQLTESLNVKLKFTTTGDQVSQAVAGGEAELGLLPVSEILPVSGVELLGTFPKGLKAMS